MTTPARHQLKAGTDAAEAARVLAASLLHELDRALAAVLRRASRGHIHELRVAAYRLEVALALFGAKASVGRALHRLRSKLGACRDLQNRRVWLAGQREGSPHGADFLSREQRPELERALASLKDALLRWQRKEHAWRGRLLELPRKGKLGGHRLRARFNRAVREVDRDVRALRDEREPERAHDLRKAIKRLRYAGELLELAFPMQLKPLLPALAAMQGQLGKLHDAGLRREWLSESRRANPEHRDELHELARRVRKEEKKHARELPSLLERWSKRAALLR